MYSSRCWLGSLWEATRGRTSSDPPSAHAFMYHPLSVYGTLASFHMLYDMNSRPAALFSRKLEVKTVCQLLRKRNTSSWASPSRSCGPSSRAPERYAMPKTHPVIANIRLLSDFGRPVEPCEVLEPTAVLRLHTELALGYAASVFNAAQSEIPEAPSWPTYDSSPGRFERRLSTTSCLLCATLSWKIHRCDDIRPSSYPASSFGHSRSALRCPKLALS